MASIYGDKIFKSDLMKKIGDISQIAGIKKYKFCDGKAEGVTAFDIKTGTLEYTVLADRGMDIAQASYKGIPISFISKTGIVSPNHYEKDGINFFRSFQAGLLTTCGLSYMGAPSVVSDNEYGLHGRYSNIPAEDLSVYQEWENDEFVMKVRGKTRESAVFAENLTLTRTITSKLGESSLLIEEEIENCGFDEQPIMLLYHFNFGYPIVSENSFIRLDTDKTTPRDSDAKSGINEWSRLEKPQHGYKEQVFYHEPKADTNGFVKAEIVNEKLGLVVSLEYDSKNLPYFVQWKQMGEGDYVLGLEPANWYPEGRKKAEEQGALTYLKAGEKIKNKFNISVCEI